MVSQNSITARHRQHVTIPSAQDRLAIASVLPMLGLFCGDDTMAKTCTERKQLRHPAVDLEHPVKIRGKGKGRRQTCVEVTCPDCGKVRFAQKGSVVYGIERGTFTGLCPGCLGTRTFTGPQHKHPRWKGGRAVDNSNGYVRITLQPDHPFLCMAANGRRQVREHRLVMAEHLGRPLAAAEVVHHKDGNPSNNVLENLRLMSQSEHIKIHRAAQKFKRVPRPK